MCVATTTNAWTWMPGLASSARETSSAAPSFEGGREVDRVHRALKRIAKARAALDAQEVAALRAAHRLQLWKDFGYASLVEYMERELGYSARAAVERIRIAISIEELVARKRSTIPPALKLKILARDNFRCLVPGCCSTNIDVHHLEPQALGGKHTEGNLGSICEGHHLATHRGTLKIEGIAPNLKFTFVGEVTRRMASHAEDTRQALLQLGSDVPLEEWLQLALVSARKRAEPSAPRRDRGPHAARQTLSPECDRGSSGRASQDTSSQPSVAP